MLRKQFGDLPTLSGDPDTSVLADVGTSQDFAAQDPLPRCKLPCSFGDWNPDPWLNCQRACKRAVGHRGRHHCLSRHPGFDHDQLLPLGSTGLLPSPPRCCCPNSCRTVTGHRFMLCDECLHRTPMGICPCVFSSRGQCCQRWDAATVVNTETTSMPSLPSPPDLPMTDWHHEVRPSKQAGTPYTGVEEGLSALQKPKRLLAEPPSTTFGGDRHTEKQAPSREHQAPGPSARRLISTYNGLTSQGRRPDRPALQYPYEPRPSHLPPGCHVCNIEHTLHAEDDELVMCNHPDGCGQLAHIDTCARECPRHPDKMICNLCHCREHVSQGRRPARPDLQYPYEQRPSHLPPGCHVCNREHTLHAEDDELVMCNHPDGCGQVAHPDTCARACPRYPDRMICNLCYRPEHAHDSLPDAISTSTLPSQSVWSLAGPPCETWTAARFIADEGILDDADANIDNTTLANRGSVSSASDNKPKRRKEK